MVRTEGGSDVDDSVAPQQGRKRMTSSPCALLFILCALRFILGGHLEAESGQFSFLVFDWKSWDQEILLLILETLHHRLLKTPGHVLVLWPEQS